MDYGPAIAAAFASQQVQDVTVIRNVLVECIQKAQQNTQSYTSAKNPAAKKNSIGARRLRGVHSVDDIDSK